MSSEQVDARHRVLPLLVTLSLGVGCGGTTRLVRPPPSLEGATYVCGNKGRYMSPFTPDGTLAKWVDKGLAIKAGTFSGMALGGVAGKIVSPNSPLGAVFAAAVGAAVGRELATEAFGGRDYIRATSEMSFNSFDEMAVYLYRAFHGNPEYATGMKAAFLIYPRLRQVYPVAVRAAVLGARAAAASSAPGERVHAANP